MFAIHHELIVDGIDTAARSIEHECFGNQLIAVEGEIVFGGNGPAPFAVGLPGVELQEDVEIVPTAVVLSFDRGVAIPTDIAMVPTGSDPQRRLDGVQAATQAPAVAIDFLEGGNSARLGGICQMVIRQQAIVVNGDRALVVGLAIARDRFDDRLQRAAIWGFVGLHLDPPDRCSQVNFPPPLPIAEPSIRRLRAALPPARRATAPSQLGDAV